MGFITTLISEKIKANAEKRKSDAIFDIIAQRVGDGKGEDEQKDIIKKIEVLKKAGFDSAEAIQAGKVMAPDSFKDQNPINVYNVGQSGELTSAGQVPSGSKVFKQALTPEEIGARSLASGEAKIETSQKESAVKLVSAVKRLEIINQQFNEALPTSGKSLEQRFSGQIAAWGAKTGISPNPKLLALLSNSRPIAINLIRLFGEVGNLSETEQQGALQTVDLKGLTEVERLEKVKQFAEYALAGANEKALDYMMKNSTVVDSVINLGIDIPGYKTQVNKKTGERRLVKSNG